MVILRKYFLLILLFIVFTGLYAYELIDGNIRLVIDERTGLYSLYYIADGERKIYEPLFCTNETASSFIAVNVDGRVHRLDQSRLFTKTFDLINGNPAFIYDSSFLTVTIVFTPVRTVSSRTTNGIGLNITVLNKEERSVPVGLRVLVDTRLGEERGSVPFSIGGQDVTRETVIDHTSEDRFWISESRNKGIALMGSFVNPAGTGSSASRLPDYVHLANWKRLYDASWYLRPSPGRSLSYFPYSPGDSAVCYYYEPVSLDSMRSFTASIFLSTEDTAWYAAPQPFVYAPVSPGPSTFVPTPAETTGQMEYDLVLLGKMLETLNQFIAGEIHLNEHDLNEIEHYINRLRAGY